MNQLLNVGFFALSLLQVLGSQSILHQGHAIPVRHFAKEAARPALKGDGEAKYAQLVRK